MSIKESTEVLSFFSHLVVVPVTLLSADNRTA